MAKAVKIILYLWALIFVVVMMTAGTSGYVKDAFDNIAVENTNGSQAFHQDLDFMDKDETKPPVLNHAITDTPLAFKSFYRQQNTAVFKSKVWQPPRV